MSVNPRKIVRERGVLAKLEAERLDGLSQSELLGRFAELANRDPSVSIEQIRRLALAALDQSKEIATKSEEAAHTNTREDLRRTAVLITEYAAHALGEIGWTEDAMKRGESDRAIYHALRAGFFAAMTEVLLHEPEAALGARQRPHPSKAGRARQSVGATPEQRYRKIVEVFERVRQDPEFPKKSLQVEEVAKRCECSARTVHRAIRWSSPT